MQDTLTYGYFEMLGILSKRKEGIESVFVSFDNVKRDLTTRLSGSWRSSSYSVPSTS